MFYSFQHLQCALPPSGPRFLLRSQVLIFLGSPYTWWVMLSSLSLQDIFFFILGFQYFYYHMSGCGSSSIILPVVCWLSWIYRWMLFVTFRNFSVLVSLFFLFFSLLVVPPVSVYSCISWHATPLTFCSFLFIVFSLIFRLHDLHHSPNSFVILPFQI